MDLEVTFLINETTLCVYILAYTVLHLFIIHIILYITIHVYNDVHIKRIYLYEKMNF